MNQPAVFLLGALLDHRTRKIEEEFKEAVLSGADLDTAINRLRRNLDEIHEARQLLKRLT